MATAVVMPKQGQSVESCIIVEWKKQKGDRVLAGEILCEIETDKALLEIESPVSGMLLELFFQAGDEVPVLTNMAAIGQPGEAVDDLRPGAAREQPGRAETPVATPQATTAAVLPALTPAESQAEVGTGISPRARNLAAREGLERAALPERGSGPGGRVIERDIQAILAQRPKMSPLARSMVAQGGFRAPAQGSGLGGRIMAGDLTGAGVEAPTRPEVQAPAPIAAEEVQTIPVKGVRKLIAERMLASLQTTAQLTLNSSADARALLAYRRRLKGSAESLGLQKVTLNDLILLAVSRILLQYPDLNALFTGNTISQYKNVHLGVAVDTPRGLMVPVIHQANRLSLRQISEEARRLANACLESTIKPDELTGGTFTVTNLGNLGIESFTPILNPPQVAILGVGNVNLKPVEIEGEVQFIPHLSLSLTINHQVVDGAPAARFLQALAQGLAGVDLLLAL